MDSDIQDKIFLILNIAVHPCKISALFQTNLQAAHFSVADRFGK